MTEEGTIDDPDPRTAPTPQPGDKPRGEPRDFPKHGPTEEDDAEKTKHSEPPEYAPGESPWSSEPRKP
jgi:hypothetical protein